MAFKVLDATGAQQLAPTWVDPTYRATYEIAVSSVAASATDVLVLTGSASVVTRVKSVRVSLKGDGTNGGQTAVTIIKRSTADTAGTTGTAPTIAPMDPNDAAASSAITVYTANPTLGTSVGTVASGVLTVAAAAGAGSEILFDFCTDFSKPPTLRAATQQLAVNFDGGGPNGITNAKLFIEICWDEGAV